MAKAKAKAKKTGTEEESLEAFSKEFDDVLLDSTKLSRDPNSLIRTGSLKLDLLLRGGFRPGTLSEIYGPEGGGKTTIALHASKFVQQRGGRVLYIDLERSLEHGMDFDEGHLPSWPEIIGLDITDRETFLLARPTTGEAIYQFIERAINSNLFELIVLDSMGAMVPRVDMDGNVGESAFGRLAKLNSEALKRVMARFDTNNVGKTHLMIINQARDKVGSSYGGIDSTGGRALKHFVRTKLRCARTGKDADAGINTINVRVDKSSFSPPWQNVNLFIHPTCGIDTTMEIIEYCVQEGLVEKGGSWYTLFDPATGEEVGKVQGATALRKLLEANPDMLEALTAQAWQRGVSSFVKGSTEEDKQ